MNIQLCKCDVCKKPVESGDIERVDQSGRHVWGHAECVVKPSIQQQLIDARKTIAGMKLDAISEQENYRDLIDEWREKVKQLETQLRFHKWQSERYLGASEELFNRNQRAIAALETRSDSMEVTYETIRHAIRILEGDE